MTGRRGTALWFVALIASCSGAPDHTVNFRDKLNVLGLKGQQELWAYKTVSGEFRFSLGLTSPVHLLSYRDAQGYPDYCHRAKVLNEIESLARRHHCDPIQTSLGDAPTLLITCNLPAPAGSNTCPSSYVAQVWQERWPNSNEDYELDMYARVRAVCAREQDFQTFHASDDVTTAAEERSDEVVELLNSCKSGRAPDGGTP